MRKRSHAKKRLLDSEQAKIFMAKAGNDFEAKGRQLVKDDYAAIREIKTATDLSAAITALTVAHFEGDITTEEANGAYRIIRAMLKKVRQESKWPI